MSLHTYSDKVLAVIFRNTLIRVKAQITRPSNTVSNYHGNNDIRIVVKSLDASGNEPQQSSADRQPRKISRYKIW